MVRQEYAQKVQKEHTEKLAFIYVRQSTLNGVKNNVVGGRRQREEVEQLALELGWTKENILIVDYDQAVSGSSTEGRYGYLDMLCAVGDGRVGAIFSLESTRVGRDSADWHCLIKLCDMSGTLVIDPDGVYDARDNNDSTLMKFKALMGEMELRWITNRLLGAKLELAKKGELRTFPPSGYTYDVKGKLIIDPDPSIQDAFRLIFSQFEKLGSALSVVKFFAAEGLKIPTVIRGGARSGEYEWTILSVERVASILHNPRYAGDFVYGRWKTIKKAVIGEGGIPQVRKHQVQVKPEQWEFVIHDAHPAYISRAQFLANQEQLRGNINGRGNRGAVRSGPALLQGLVLCGKCGRKMSILYDDGRLPYYVCWYEKRRFGGEKCQTTPGTSIEVAIENLFLEAVQPAQIRLSLTALENVQEQSSQKDRQWDVRLKRAEQAVGTAKDRFLFADYTNKYAFNCAQDDLQKREEELSNLKHDHDAASDRTVTRLSREEIHSVQALTEDLPRVWRDATTEFLTKKKLLRCLISEVTLTRDGSIVQVGVRWKTLACTELSVALAKPGDHLRTPLAVIERIRELAQDHTNLQIAEALNQDGVCNMRGGAFTVKRVKRLRERHGLNGMDIASFPEEREDGRLRSIAVARMLGVHKDTVSRWCRKGWLDAKREGPRDLWWIHIVPSDIAKLQSRLRFGKKACLKLFEDLEASPFKREDGCYRAAAVAKLLGVNVGTVDKWCGEGRLVATRDGPGDLWCIRIEPGEIAKLKSEIDGIP